MYRFTNDESLNLTIHKGLAAAFILIVATVAIALADGGAATGEGGPAGTVLVDAIQVDDLGTRSSQLDDVAFRIEPVDGLADPILGRTSTGRSASAELAPGDYWVTVDRTELDGEPCFGSDRVMIRVSDDATLAVAAFVTTSAPVGLDPICMGVTRFPSGPILDPCVAELEPEAIGDDHLACAEAWALDLADLLVGTD